MRLALALLLFLPSCGKDTTAPRPADQPGVVWEQVAAHVYRFEVRGGWIVRYKNYYAGGLTFVPDINHEWELR